MQYHVNGFKPGDPDISPAARKPRLADDPLPTKVDVLIAGSGPAGLCLAAQLAKFSQIETMVVEPKLIPMEKGQADGISVRTMEMFQAFGFGEKVLRESFWINETTFWGGHDKRLLDRLACVQDVPDGTSEMPHVIINQARVHELFLDVMRHSPSKLAPDYGWKVADLHVDITATQHPVTVTLTNTTPGREGQTHTVLANYVVGCDGARSSVRKAIGGSLHGDAAHQAWGVIDLLAVTDFPDWRKKSFVRSKDNGTLMVIPREGGHLVRLYVEMDKLSDHERAAELGMGADDIIAKAQRIFSPFKLDVKEVVWSSVYEIGHRLTDKFDDVPQAELASRFPRVMLAGDACHTHSPKAGQGMNVSMGDTFNLGWKLIAVLCGRADAALLHTYSGERRAAAKGLVEFDHKWSRVVGAHVEDAPQEQASKGDLPHVAREFVNNLPFTCGLTIAYPPSAITGSAQHQSLATGFDIGKRLHSAPVLRLADAKPMQLSHVIDADARFRLFVFAGAQDTGQAGQQVSDLCNWLAHDAQSPIRRHTPASDDLDTVIDTRAIFQQPSNQLAHESMPTLLRPAVGRYGLCDYEKVFCAGNNPNHDIFDARGVDRAKGCIVVVRPDQHVGHVLPLTAREELTAYFSGIFRQSTPASQLAK